MVSNLVDPTRRICFIALGFVQQSIEVADGGRRKQRETTEGQARIGRMVPMMSLARNRRASTSLMFAVFAAVLTVGMLHASKAVKSTMVAAITKQAPIRY